jgi:hypothetical protein
MVFPIRHWANILLPLDIVGSVPSSTCVVPPDPIVAPDIFSRHTLLAIYPALIPIILMLVRILYAVI